MGIALGGSGLAMPEHLADEIQTSPARYGDRGEAVPKIMDPDIVERGACPNALPRLLNADKMSVAAFGRENIRAAFVMRQFRQRAKRGRSERNRDPSPARFAVLVAMWLLASSRSEDLAT
jgi:hypothetical protein